MSCIQEAFADKSVFITGATGFLGKLIVEKILRSCDEVKTIYILIRQKRNSEFFIVVPMQSHQFYISI